jgi:hypothetical protein
MDDVPSNIDGTAIEELLVVADRVEDLVITEGGARCFPVELESQGDLLHEVLLCRHVCNDPRFYQILGEFFCFCFA